MLFSFNVQAVFDIITTLLIEISGNPAINAIGEILLHNPYTN
jgi:hypothetical protein